MEEKKKLDWKQLREVVADKAKIGIAKAQDGASKVKDVVSSTASSVIQPIDCDGDGKLTKEDIAELKRQFMEKQRQAKLRRDLNALNPIFLNDLSGADFFLSKMVQVAEMDKKHSASSLCEGSIGHETLVKELRIVTIYPQNVDVWGLEFYPDKDQEFYYVNPIDPHQYIAVGQFFDYLRLARVSELQRIAQDLGATHFKVSIGEEKKSRSHSKKSFETASKVKLPIKWISASSSEEYTQASTAESHSINEIAAETSFKGHAPVRPQLVYYQNEPQIQGLVAMRMDNPDNGITSQHLTLKCANSSGVTQTDAAKINAAFSMMKFGGSTNMVGNFASEAHEDVNRIFQYDIEF